MHRRSFLRNSFRQAAGLVVLPQYVTAAAAGRGTQPAPSNRVVLGCIGVGGRGRADMRGLLECGGVQVLAVCDVNEKSRRAALQVVGKYYDCSLVRRHNPGCDTYNDFRDLLTRRDIDAVLIATPDHWHIPIAVRAVRAGKDVYCEKPLSLTIDQGRTISDAVKRQGVVFQTGTQQRSDKRFRFACELVRNGYIGKLHTVEVEVPGSMSCDGFYPGKVPAGFDYDMWLGPAPREPYSPRRVDAFGWRWIFDYAGGCVTDWGAHHMDIAQWGMGTTHTGPISVAGKGYFPRDGLFDTAVHWRFECEYAGGVKVICFAREEFKWKFPNGIKFMGDDGWVYVNRSMIDAQPKSLLDEKIGYRQIRLYRSDNHYRNFLECVRSRREPAAPVEEAHRSVTVCHLGNIAMRLGRKIHWDPQRETIIGDDQARRMLSRPLRSPWTLGI